MSAIRRRARVVLCLSALTGSPLSAQADQPSCPTDDSVVGPQSAAHRRASLLRSSGPTGIAFARTGTRRRSASGLALAASWSIASPGSTIGVQLHVLLPTATATRLRESTDTMQHSVDDWLVVPLGVPSLAQIAGDRLPPLLPISVNLTTDDLRSLAKAQSAEVRYAGGTIRLDPSDLAATNALYRLLVCSRIVVPLG